MDAVSVALTSAAATLAGVAGYLLAEQLMRPYPKLNRRLHDYVFAAGRILHAEEAGAETDPAWRRFARQTAALLGTAEDEALLRRLRQGGMLQDVDRENRAKAFRAGQLRDAGLFGAAGAVTGWSLFTPAAAAALAVLLACLGAGRLPGRLDRRIAARAQRMRAELYSVNHLIAMHLQAGGTVRATLPRVAERGSGPVCEELRDVLRAHASGTTLSLALTKAAEATCEPSAAATYRLLAQGTMLGTALGDALLDMSRTLRQERVEEIKRLAIRRGHRMLLPTMLLLAPMMVLFVGSAMLHVMGGVF